MVYDARPSTPTTQMADESAVRQERGWRKWAFDHMEHLLAPFVLAIGVLLWALLVRWRDYPAFIELCIYFNETKGTICKYDPNQ